MPPSRHTKSVLLWLSLVAALLAFCVQSGELGSADTMHRLQTAHSFWTSEPPVFPNEYPEFGAHGRDGKLYDWYGIGQPLLMLPFDIAGTYIAKLPIFADYDGSDPTVRNIFVSYCVNTLLSVLTALVAFRFLRLLEFAELQSAAGVLTLLFCTTHLHYTQNMMENNYIFLLTLAGFCFQYEWLRTGNRRALLIGSFALGLNLLTRLTTGLDLIAVAIFLFSILLFEHRAALANKLVGAGALARPVERSSTTASLRRKILDYSAITAPIYAFFFFLDRLYQFCRFGSWTNTYVHYFTLERRLQDPTLPANYPWTTPFYKGFLGPLISPEKSIFLFDPLMVLTIVLVVLVCKRFSAATKAYVLSTLFLSFAYISFYAHYYEWSGNFAWGDRYVSTSVQLAAFISVPLLLKFRHQFGHAIWISGITLIFVSLIIQIASLAFWLPLEIYQADDFGHPQWIIWLRLKNIAAFTLGKMDAWGLNTDSMGYDQWDFQHMTCWNFLPFVLRRIGAAPKWAVDTALVAWTAAMAALLYSISRLVERLMHMVECYHEHEH